MEDDRTCLFVYGIVDAGEWADGGAALRDALSGLPGVDPLGSPEVLVLGRLGVLVSRVPLAEFTGERFEAHLEDVAWLAPRARAHAAVNSTALCTQAVLPMRFGTLFSAAGPMEEALLPREQELLEELSATRGLEEWSLRVCGHPERLMEQMAEMQAGSQAGGPGAQYLLRRRLAVQGRTELLARLTARAQEVHAALEPLARHVEAARTEVEGLPGGLRSLLSRVYVIGRDERDAFLAQVQHLADTLPSEGLSLMCSGPWPPVRAGGWTA